MTVSRRSAMVLGAAGWAGAAGATPVPPGVLQDLAPTGALRAAINYGNPVLAQRDPASGAAGGVSVALAHALRAQLGVPVTLVPFEEAGLVFAALSHDAWDIAFLAIEPVRAAVIAFTAPYVLIEGCYVVRDAQPQRDAAAMDQPGLRIAVAQGSAYDLYLTRTLRHAALVRVASSAGAVAAFEADGLDALAGVRQPLQGLVAERPGLRLLNGAFMSIAQAMGTQQGKAAGHAYLEDFIHAAKASGFVAAELLRSGHGDVTVPPV